MHARTHAHTYKHTYKHTCQHTYQHTQAHTHTHTHTHTWQVLREELTEGNGLLVRPLVIHRPKVESVLCVL